MHSPTAPGHPWRPRPRPGVFGIQTCPRIFLLHFSGAPRRRDGSTICFLVRGRGAAMHKSGGFPSPDPSTRHRPRARQCTAIGFQTTLPPCCETSLVTVAQRTALHQDLARKNDLESTEAEARDGCTGHININVGVETGGIEEHVPSMLCDVLVMSRTLFHAIFLVISSHL
jgi:hypothetical protein